MKILQNVLGEGEATFDSHYAMWATHCERQTKTTRHVTRWLCIVVQLIIIAMSVHCTTALSLSAERDQAKRVYSYMSYVMTPSVAEKRFLSLSLCACLSIYMYVCIADCVSKPVVPCVQHYAGETRLHVRSTARLSVSVDQTTTDNDVRKIVYSFYQRSTAICTALTLSFCVSKIYSTCSQ